PSTWLLLSPLLWLCKLLPSVDRDSLRLKSRHDSASVESQSPPLLVGAFCWLESLGYSPIDRQVQRSHAGLHQRRGKLPQK
ncbi:MAG: hypothetical protein VKK03_07670, partial [Synechococcus sp.]|nr:hypothetical protein [Synechococcus sp.]